MTGLSRREVLRAGAAAALALGAGVPPAAAAVRPGRRKILDIGPGGVIDPGSAQDLRRAGNVGYFIDTGTRWIRMWADWPSLQPHPGFAPDDPASPGRSRLRALDEQVALAREVGLRVILMPYRFPRWVSGTAALAWPTGTDAEVSYRHADRMARAEWERYVGAGRDTRRYDPRRRALEYELPEDPYGPDSAWAGFFAFLYERYAGLVEGFELVNEPNLQLWPQQSPAAGPDPFAPGVPRIAREVARLMLTAQGISAGHAHAAMLLAPSISDTDQPSTRRYTRDEEFVPALLEALAAIGYLPHSRQAWSHHNYTDVERRRVPPRVQLLRSQIAGRWGGHTAGAAPTVFVTEGGARLSRMPALYPGEDPREAQAECLRRAYDAAGPGVAMFAQYLLYADPNFDCGLIDPYPSGRRRPAYAAWKALPA